MTIDAKSYSNLLRYDEEHERIDFFGDGFIWKIDNGLRKYCNDLGGVRNLSSENEVLVDGNGKKYIVLTLQNYGVDKYYKISSEMQEVKKHLADEILSGEMGGLSALTKDELMALLKI